MSIEDRVAKLEELILGRLVVNKEGCLEKMLLSQGNSEEQILDMQKQMIDYIGRGCKKHPRYLNLDENFMVKDIEAFKAYLENSWFDRSGDTDGIAVGVSLKQASAQAGKGKTYLKSFNEKDKSLSPSEII